jgi:hypothetical protein
VSSYPSNQERTEDCLKIFDREKNLKYLLKNKSPIILDVGVNNGGSLFFQSQLLQPIKYI